MFVPAMHRGLDCVSTCVQNKSRDMQRARGAIHTCCTFVQGQLNFILRCSNEFLSIYLSILHDLTMVLNEYRAFHREWSKTQSTVATIYRWSKM